MDYKPLIAKSGEVFYTINGNLKKANNMQEYNKILEKEKVLQETFFEFYIGKDYHKILATRTAMIMHLITSLPTHKQNALIDEYTQILRKVESL